MSMLNFNSEEPSEDYMESLGKPGFGSFNEPSIYDEYRLITGCDGSNLTLEELSTNLSYLTKAGNETLSCIRHANRLINKINKIT